MKILWHMILMVIGCLALREIRHVESINGSPVRVPLVS